MAAELEPELITQGFYAKHNICSLSDDCRQQLQQGSAEQAGGMQQLIVLKEEPEMSSFINKNTVETFNVKSEVQHNEAMHSRDEIVINKDSFNDNLVSKY